MTASEFAVVSESMTKRFWRKVALNSVSLHVPTGTIYGLMGPNGAGKTTFVRCLLNLLTPTSGRAAVCGLDAIRNSVAVRRRVGHVAALQPLWDWMRVREYAAFTAACYAQWNRDLVADLLSRMGIGSDEVLRDLSRGQRTLAALAIAIGHGPDLLILDEALTGLDPIARREVLRGIIEMMHSQGRTVFITGQDIADMERICDHVGFLVKGRLVMESPLDDLKGRVKEIRLSHSAEVQPQVPPDALAIQRDTRETRFITTAFSQELCTSLAAPQVQVEIRDLGLEDIFVAVAQAHRGPIT
jgi:ABC-2 type transport system ATP-binding protein